MPPRGRRPVGGPDTREQILTAAGELFSELGFERTTMRAVAARADVDAALIHHYFVNKEGLAGRGSRHAGRRGGAAGRSR